jgi:hypothetical protein
MKRNNKADGVLGNPEKESRYDLFYHRYKLQCRRQAARRPAPPSPPQQYYQSTTHHKPPPPWQDPAATGPQLPPQPEPTATSSGPTPREQKQSRRRATPPLTGFNSIGYGLGLGLIFIFAFTGNRVFADILITLALIGFFCFTAAGMLSWFGINQRRSISWIREAWYSRRFRF